MKSVKILLEKTRDVKDFIALTQDCDYEILLKSGRYVVDGKSLLGIFSLDLSRPIVAELYSDECDELLQKLQRFLTA